MSSLRMPRMHACRANAACRWLNSTSTDVSSWIEEDCVRCGKNHTDAQGIQTFGIGGGCFEEPTCECQAEYRKLFASDCSDSCPGLLGPFDAGEVVAQRERGLTLQEVQCFRRRPIMSYT